MILSYSHVNEDSRAERQLLISHPYETIACVAGSGERVLALLDQPALKNVFAIDTNPTALYLLELKIAALTELGVDQYLNFIGSVSDLNTERITAFKYFKRKLSPACLEYWERQEETINRGVVNAGHFEKFIHRIRPILRLYFGKSVNQFVFSQPDNSEFPSLRWIPIKLVFSQRWTYELLGNRDVAFIAGDASRSKIPEVIEQQVLDGVAWRSFMTHLIFRGDFNLMGENEKPLSFQKIFLKSIHEKLHSPGLKIHYCHGDWMKQCHARELFNRPSVFYSMSDLPSFVPLSYLEKFLSELLGKSSQSRAVVMRSFLRNQLSSEFINSVGHRHEVDIQDLSAHESSGMYQVYGFATNCKDDRKPELTMVESNV